MIVESHARSIVKAASYRVWATLTTALLVFLWTRRWSVALAVGAADAASKVLLFYLHERGWSRVSFGRSQIKPAVVWLTGLSGSGKTTLADGLVRDLLKRGLRAEKLDGDVIRALFPDSGFSREDRRRHVERVAHLASVLERNGVVPVVSLISPFSEDRGFARRLANNFIEVHVATPLAVCEGRDAKGLYAKARRGEIREFTGVDSVYEAPVSAELVLDASDEDPSGAVERLCEFVGRRLRP